MKQSQALDIIKTGANIFLTGEPGSGKTHIINKYVSYLRSCGVEPAITASTGIASTHIGGMTIHSWSGIGIKSELSRYELDKIVANKKNSKRIKETKVLIIDEISMLPSETLNLVELVCRKVKKNHQPFGGLQVIFVGDFFQLPPIIKNQVNSNQQKIFSIADRFAYGSSAWQSACPMVCYLTEQYRQDDKDYLDLLSAIRNNCFNDDHACRLEKCQISVNEIPKNLPKLFSHNFDVDRVNQETLRKLAGKIQIFKMNHSGPKFLVEALKRGCLSPEILELKIGAVVMFTKNSPKNLFVNGTLGTVERFDSANNFPIVRLRDGRLLKVDATDWVLEENGNDLARINQFPLRLAWAITIHKSQGMSLDGAVMDLSKTFEYGQGYVALSRLRRLSGLKIIGWNNRAFEVHPEIIAKDTDFKLASRNSLSFLSNLSLENLKEKQDNFINLCRGRVGLMSEKEILDFYPIKKKQKIDTQKETLFLWKEGKEISEIAKIRELKENTILTHLEKLFDEGLVKVDELFRLVSEDLCQALPEIHQVLRQSETNKLTEVFSRFGGRFSFEDLRLAKMVLKNK